MAADFCLEVALIHYPVINRNGEIIGSAVTNLDLHDIARAGRTFGVSTYWVVTPYPQQQDLAAEIVGHWTEGYGSKVNADRAAALSIIRIIGTLEGVIAEMTQRHGCRPKVIATSARPVDSKSSISYASLRQELRQGRPPVLLLFGTAWGLAAEAMAQADAVLPPIAGAGAFNHLSVRSAAAIMLDRLVGSREEVCRAKADEHLIQLRGEVEASCGNSAVQQQSEP